MAGMSTIHEQHYLELRRLVEQMAGQRLPGERELAARLNLSRPRVRALLTMLENEGLVERLQGSGTYAVDTQPGRLESVALLIDESLKLGEDPFFSLLIEQLQFCLQSENVHCLIERIDGLHTPRVRYDAAITLGQAGARILHALTPGAAPLVGLLLDTAVPVGLRASIFQLADREAGREAAHNLLATHCQRLLFVGRREIPASRERLAGVEEIIAEQEQEQGAEQNVQFQFVNCSLNYAAGVKLGRELARSVILQTNNGKGQAERAEETGIIAGNDWLAVGLRAGLASADPAGTAVRIVSFDGLPMAADPVLAINSLTVPLEALASDAVAELRRLLRSPVAVGRQVRYPLTWR